MSNWWSREAQRQRELAAGADADLMRDNRKRFTLSFILIGAAAGLAVISRGLHLSGWTANVCFGVSILLGASGLASFKWAQAESSFLNRPGPEEPPRITK